RRRAAIFGGAPGVGVELGVRVLHHCFPRGSLLLRRLRHGVSRPPLQHWEATPSTPPSLRYALLKANVDEMELVQLGLTLFDAFGHLPDIGTGGRVGYVWEFNFREFDVRRDPHAPDSIDLLRSSGIDFDRLPRFGIDSGDFAALLCRSGLVAHCRFCRPLSARWIAFHGCYDFAYLIKVLGNGTPLPDTLEEFLGLVNLLFGETVDLKYMMFGCEGLSGGLESVASTLGATPSWEVASSWLR
ncbi:CCR4-associated factor, partial [Musa troglodytarum]